MHIKYPRVKKKEEEDDVRGGYARIVLPSFLSGDHTHVLRRAVLYLYCVVLTSEKPFKQKQKNVWKGGRGVCHPIDSETLIAAKGQKTRRDLFFFFLPSIL